MIQESKKRVLFVCVGNACRSQMAEGFARTYGSDVMIPASAGLAPASGVASATIRAMDEKNIDLRDHFFKYPFGMLCYSERSWRRLLPAGHGVGALFRSPCVSRDALAHSAGVPVGR